MSQDSPFKRKNSSYDEQAEEQSGKCNLKAPSTQQMLKKILSEKNNNQIDSINNQKNNILVLGICGGDCSGKNQLINYMLSNQFLKKQNEDILKEVTIIHQSYFFKDKETTFEYEGTDWDNFIRCLVYLQSGNNYKLTIPFSEPPKQIVLKGSSSLIILQGTHVFVEQNKISEFIDLKVFIDSDDDVRLSRRVYKDTVLGKLDLNSCVKRYLQKIKPSYQKEIKPTKITSHIIIPQYGDGYDDFKFESESSIKIRKNMHKFTQMLLPVMKQKMTFKEEGSISMKREERKSK